MIQEILEFKARLETLKETDDTINKSIVSKLIVMNNLAEMCMLSETKLNNFDNIEYFHGQAFVGRYFGDLGLDWVVVGYLKIAEYMKKGNYI